MMCPDCEKLRHEGECDDEPIRLNNPEAALEYLLTLQTKYRPITTRTNTQEAEITRASDICTLANIRAGK